MPEISDSSEKTLSAAQKIFKNAKPEYQALIRDILKDERDTMHLKRRPEIHQKIYSHIVRVIK